jgi:hypothetical protein
MKKLAALLLFSFALSLWAQDKPHRLVEVGIDAAGSFANSYVRTGDIFKEKIVLDMPQISGDLKNGLEVFFDARWEAFLNLNLGSFWGFGFFAGMDARGQFKIPQSMFKLLAEGNQDDKTYSDDLPLGGAVFFETGFWASAKIRRIKFTVRPAYFLPLAYLSNPKVNYAFAINDNGSVTVAGNYKVDVYSPLPRDEFVILNDIAGGVGDTGALSGAINIATMLEKGGMDLILRAEYPALHNLVVGGSLSHIPLIPAQLTDKYSLNGSFEMEKTLEDVLNNDFALPDLEQSATYGADHKTVFRPFKIGADAIYRPFAIRLVTLRPQAALVFNGIYETPVYLDFGITGELNLVDLLIIDVGTRLEDLVWKERVGLTLNFKVIEFSVGVTTQSQQFIRSFQGAGFAVDLGVRVGF